MSIKLQDAFFKGDKLTLTWEIPTEDFGDPTIETLTITCSGKLHYKEIPWKHRTIWQKFLSIVLP